LNPLLCTSISELLERADLAFVGKDPRCLPPTVIDMASFRMALAECARRGLPLGEVLALWQNSTLSQMSFREWCVTAPDAPASSEGPAPWMNLAMAELGLPALP
jgi:hypothetical protein